MRLLMLNNEFPPLGGGTGTVNLAILQRMASVPGLEVDLITSALGRQAEKDCLAERIRIFKVPVNNRMIHHSSNRELIAYAAQAWSLARRLHRAHSYNLSFAWSAVPAGGVSWALRRQAGLPYLVRVSGPDIPGFEPRYKTLYPVLTPIIRSIWLRAEAVVAKCEGEASMIRAVDQNVPVALIPNGVDLDAFRERIAPPDNGPLRLICVGRLIERKGQYHLIQAVKRLLDQGIDVVLDLIGTGDSQASYEAQARALGMEKKVHFVGYVPREEIAACYEAAHVFVLPSYNEGMSVATLEAMAAGLPLVVSRAGGTTRLVAEGVNGWTFSWGDVEGLTVHLRRLAFDRALARRLGAASRVRAAQFSWDQAFEKYMTLFEEITRQTASLRSARIGSSFREGQKRG
jgi:glycosyltransferase involved in cell wall biosynthesis